MNIKELKRVIKKFRIDNDTVLLVKAGSPMADKMTLNTFEQAVKEMGLRNVLVIVVDDLDDVTVLNKMDMNRLGWHRLDDVRRLVSPKPRGPFIKEKPEEEQVESS